MIATKEQERKALEKIRKIIADLGEDSYIGTAFDGCLEIAESNIDNDFACSMKQRAEQAEHNEEYFHNIANSLAQENQNLEKQIEELKDNECCLKNTIDDLVKQRDDANRATLAERKDITIETVDGVNECKPFEKVQFFNNDGFRFANVVEKSGWTTSYKIDDLVTMIVE